MTIEEVVNMTLQQSAARARGRMGAAASDDTVPIATDVLLQRNIADSEEDFSEEEIVWAAEQIGVEDVEKFLLELESWV